jgi:hypothetical protein
VVGEDWEGEYGEGRLTIGLQVGNLPYMK